MTMIGVITWIGYAFALCVIVGTCVKVAEFVDDNFPGISNWFRNFGTKSENEAHAALEADGSPKKRTLNGLGVKLPKHCVHSISIDGKSFTVKNGKLLDASKIVVSDPFLWLAASDALAGDTCHRRPAPVARFQEATQSEESAPSSLRPATLREQDPYETPGTAAYNVLRERYDRTVENAGAYSWDDPLRQWGKDSSQKDEN
jgi:hypothetical protein